MGRGRLIPVETQWIIVRLASRVSKEDISVYTDVSLASINRILQYFKTHGTVKDSSPKDSSRPERQHLRDVEVQVLYLLRNLPLTEHFKVLIWCNKGIPGPLS
jgi:hypothetical protein